MSEKIEREKRNLGSGSGDEIYEGDLFRVTKWFLTQGKKTTIESCYGGVLDNLEIHLKDHHEIDSDVVCLEQLTAEETVEVIEEIKKSMYRKGREDKAQEIRESLGV